MKNVFSQTIAVFFAIALAAELAGLDVVSSPARAEECAPQAKPDAFLMVAPGLYNFARSTKTFSVAVEYRFSEKFYMFRNAIGANYSTTYDFNLYAATGPELYFSKSTYLMPFFGAGFYKHGNGIDSGFPIEFREGFELGYKFDSGHQVNIGAYHTSNATLSKLRDKPNPGLEVFYMGFVAPIYFQN